MSSTLSLRLLIFSLAICEKRGIERSAGRRQQEKARSSAELRGPRAHLDLRPLPKVLPSRGHQVSVFVRTGVAVAVRGNGAEAGRNQEGPERYGYESVRDAPARELRVQAVRLPHFHGAPDASDQLPSPPALRQLQQARHISLVCFVRRACCGGVPRSRGGCRAR